MYCQVKNLEAFPYTCSSDMTHLFMSCLSSPQSNWTVLLSTTGLKNASVHVNFPQICTPIMHVWPQQKTLCPVTQSKCCCLWPPFACSWIYMLMAPVTFFNLHPGLTKLCRTSCTNWSLASSKVRAWQQTCWHTALSLLREESSSRLPSC